MNQSHIIEVNGVFLGVAVRVDTGFRFVSVDRRVSEIDGRMTSTLNEARRSAISAFHQVRTPPPDRLAPAMEAARPPG